MALATFDERDRQIAAMVLDEIRTVKEDQKRFGWAPGSGAWNRAFGKLSGLYTILQLIDPQPMPAEREIAEFLK